MKGTQSDVAFFERWAGQFVITIQEFEFKADATAAHHCEVEKMSLDGYSKN